ncbi:MAG: hypothetical protein ACAH11_12630, partial [Sphingomonas sp.]
MIKWLSNNRSEIIYAILLVLGLIAVIFCLVSVGRKTLTPTESNLLAVSLTFASLFLSWVTTTLYHNTGASRATRDKDVQRANNIQSIKQQLNMLMDWNRKQARSIAENDERMKFHCEHLSEVLTGLDFQFDAMIKEIGGNIGDADRQATELLTSVKVIGTKIQDLESQKQEIEAKSVEAVTPELYDLLQLQIQDITAHQESLKDSMATFITENKSAPATEAKSEFVDLSCPQCGFINKIEMAGFAGETRAHRCRSCDTVFNVHCTSPGIFISRLSAGFNGGGTVRFNGLTTTDGVTDVI